MVVVAGNIVVVADLHDGAGVIACNPERDALVARLRREAPVDVFDFGDDGKSAAETAAAWDGGPLRIVGGPRDGRAVDLLVAACAARGIDTTAESLPDSQDDDGAMVRVDAADPMACFAELQRRGGRARLAPARTAERSPALRRSPLPSGMPWGDPDWRAALLGHVAALAPLRYHALVAQIGLHDLGANPIEDAYAGNGIRDRNRELLVNIVE